MLGTPLIPGTTRMPSGAALPRVAELPFFERELYELLGFDLGREALDLEYTGFGWARPTRLSLESTEAPGGIVIVEKPLLLALHSADDAPALESDVLLELVLDDERGVAVATPLSRFLDVWLPRLPASAAVVLALCNPHRARLPRLPGGRTLWYALGDVDSWLDPLEGPPVGAAEARAGGKFRLSAPRWQTA